MAESDVTKGSEKSRLIAFLLCFFLGFFGIHRFYVRKKITGIMQLMTFGGLGMWTLIDLIRIAKGGFKDKKGVKILNWY